MTGLAAHMDDLYLSSRSQNRTYRYSLPGLYGQIASTRFGSASGTRDIARNSEGLIWVATDDYRTPVHCYNSAGRMVSSVSGDVVSSAAGITIDTEGNLWISNNEDGIICCIDLSE